MFRRAKAPSLSLSADRAKSELAAARVMDDSLELGEYGGVRHGGGQQAQDRAEYQGSNGLPDRDLHRGLRGHSK
jgi:hypothetical protein